MEKFVDGWNVVQTLGEGAYGEVKLLIHETTNDAVALKMINLNKTKDAKETACKEEKIHRLLHHPHVIRMLGKRQENEMMYIFLEFASGGELFDRIEPDVGMQSSEAQKYLRQLLDGLNYLHNRGITHRDIKPENLLLDEDGNIKISDFGMATIFRYKGRERLLQKRCGTLPYVAPEVLLEPYHAQPADIWSCGIVFIAMLTGELPWAEPLPDSPEYMRWIESTCITESLWNKLSTMALSLARKILHPDPKGRITLQGILEHTWMRVEFNSEYDITDSPEPKAKRMALPRDNKNTSEIPLLPLSQPTRRSRNIDTGALATLLKSKDNSISFSQPVQNDDLLLSSQLSLTQSQVAQNKFQRLVKRMTRFYVKTNEESTLRNVGTVLNNLEYSWILDAAGVITVSTIDCRKMQLIFKITTITMEERVLVDFRLSKGCGIEFKRRFLQIKKMLSDIRVP